MTNPKNSTAAVSAVNLSKSYRRRCAVDGVSLEVGRGEVLGMLGSNGAGKTTTVEMIAGLRRPDHGSIRVLGLDPRSERRQVRQVLGIQLQDSYLHHALTVAELVALYRSFYARPLPAAELLALVGLEGEENKRFEALSGGQQQRLSIALALAGRPKVAILDELSTGLDPLARRHMWSLVERLRNDGAAVLLVTHAMEEAERLCDRVVLLRKGRIIALGAPSQVAADAGARSLEEAFLELSGRPVLEPKEREDPL